MALVILGTRTRPTGSDGYPPVAGTVVPYALAQPIVDLDAQADRFGWPNLGMVASDFAHLSKHGGHTPWRAGSKRGVVWAMDRTMPPSFHAWLVATCKSNYDTSWIRFFNIGGRQYDWGGNYLGPSGDYHLHLEVQDGHELRHVTLFDDYAEEMGEVSAEDVWAHVIPSPSLGNRTAGEWLKGGEKAASAANTAATLAVTANTKVDAVIAQLGIVLTEVDTLEETSAQTIALVQAIQVGDWDALAERLEASQRASLLDALQRVRITIDE